MDEEILFSLGFSHCLGIGPVRFDALVREFGDLKKAYQAKEKELARVIGQNLAQKFVRFRAQFDPVKKRDELEKKGIKIIPRSSSFYPSVLKNIPDPPICLYAKGNLTVFSPEKISSSPADDSQKSLIEEASRFFAIIGTRRPTSYGEQVARKFASELAGAGFIIVSGMAMGIDAAAHWGALSAGGKTVAVLGCGVDIIYPSVNQSLYERIVKGSGIVISEFPPGHQVAKGLFIARNRIISGLSEGVLVVEGLKDSGALITARYAAEQGKEVFAPPVPLTSQMSQAPNMLLKQGAKLVTSVDDIYEELGVKILPKNKQEIDEKLSSAEKIIFNVLSQEPLMIDELAIRLNQPITQVLPTISLLEIKGMIEKNQEGKYQVKF